MPAVYVHVMHRQISGRDLGFCERVGSGLGNGRGAPRAAEAPSETEDSNLPDPPLLLCLLPDKMQKILDNEKHLELGKETKASQLGLQLGILR